MGRKIFVSYKHSDDQVAPLGPYYTTARDYVNKLESYFDMTTDIYKGERDGESLEGFKDSTIRSRLRDKIFDSSVTVVLISKGMKDASMPESDQWIPWEIEYSLTEVTRGGTTSASNAVLAVVLPDENGSYEHFVVEHWCPVCSMTTWHTYKTFKVLSTNMFNKKAKNLWTCASGCGEQMHIGGDHSYVHPVKWTSFVSNPQLYVDHVVNLRDRINEYEITKRTS